MKKNVIIKAFVIALGFSVISLLGNALDYPHNEINSIGCNSCHILHGGSDLLPPHTPANIDDTQRNVLCWSCHNDLVAPYERTHSSLATDNGYGDWTVECTTCHDPHKQRQFWTYGSPISSVYEGNSTALTATTLTQAGAGWTPDAYRGFVVFPNIDQKNYNYEITGNTVDTLTVEGPIDLSQVTVGDTFAIVYGNLIKSTIQAPDRATCTIIGNEYVCGATIAKTVRFFRESGANSFADGDTTYDGVCEVCHTMTQYWRADGSEPVPGHNPGTQCTTCHPHAEGFKASCNGCHGNPPVDAGTLVFNPPVGTGSTTAGVHDAHVTTNGILCEECHVNSVGSGATHNSGLAVTMGFSPFGGGYEGGSYDGQTTVSYDSSEAGTTVSNLGNKTCANLYCHGNYDGSGLNATPIWDNPTSGDCGTCHGASNTTHPNSGAHEEHASDARFEFQCTLCHQNIVGGTEPASYTVADRSRHVNGSVDWEFDDTDPRITVSSTYSIASGTARPSDGTTPRAYGDCGNVYCHSIAQTATGGALTLNTSDYKTPTWSSATFDCSGCHSPDIGHNFSGLPPISSGSHTAHLAYPFNLSYQSTKCAICHKWNAAAPFDDCTQCHASERYTMHVNHQVDVLFDPEFGNANYNGTLSPGDGFSDCSNTYCHSNGTSVSTGTIPANTSPIWGSGTLACDGCHGNAPDYVNGSPKANSHTEHSSYPCQMCHNATTTTGTTITSTSNHVNKAYTLQAGSGVSFSYSFAPTGGTCSSISCHGGGTAVWGGSLSCADCHTGSGDVDDYTYSNGTTARLDTTEWSSSGHGSSNVYPVSGNTGANLSDCAYCHDGSVGHDQGMNPFRLANIGGADGQNGICWVCHKTGSGGYDPDGGGPLVLENSTVKVDSYHYGVDHGAGNNGGRVCWDCHDPHGDANIYMVHGTVTTQSDGTYGIPSTTAATVFTNNAVGSDYAPIAGSDGVCQVCHTSTSYYNPTPNGHFTDACVTCHAHTGDQENTAFGHGGNCITCHGHDAGTLYDPDASAPYTPGASGSQGNGTFQSHSTHTETDSDDQRGPGIYCDACHDINDFPYFKSGTDVTGDSKYNLAETDVCDTCHSPGGTYDGVDDPVIGAKNNWSDSGSSISPIYAADGSLQSGKEKWCAGCHDEVASVIQSVSAPNVVGDEDAVTRYGTGYGFYKTGHGLAINKRYPATDVPGAGISCLDCHNSEMPHFDGITRTYAPDSDYLTYDPVSANYQDGFRLKDVSTGYNNQYPLHIPRTGNVFPPGFREDWEFALCFECHDRDALLGPIGNPNTKTNFRDHPISIENFETGDLTLFSWTTGGDGNWSVQSTVLYEGTYAAQAPLISDSQMSYLEVTITNMGNEGISFWYKVSSEVGDDSLRFLIDGIEQDSWSGEIDWTKASYLVTPGQRTFRWEYTKGSAGTAGSDTAWIDYITFYTARNSHDLHTDGRNGPWGPATPQYDSDFDGTADSRMSCPACHNVHGSASPAMFRHGELTTATSPVVDTIPFMDLQYVPIGGPGSGTTLPDSTGGGGTRFYATGAGTINRNGVCNMCHNEYWFDGASNGSSHTGYRRAPIDAFVPAIAWVNGQVGSNILQVRFSEGVYSDLGAVGDLTPADFTLTDTDNNRTITGVTHTTGDSVATLTLSSPLDATNDIGTDTLAAATAASIYDILSNAMDTAPVTISGDPAPPTLSDQNPTNGVTDVAVDSNLILTLSDNESGIDWTTFSIVLLGDKGYSRTYTDTDTSVVSKAGTLISYDIIVNPDADFGSDEIITVTVNVNDLAGNSLVPPTWSFTTTAGVGPQTMILHTSDVASAGVFGTAGGAWADILDSNDGDASYAHACCGPGGSSFSVDIDDPVGLGGATIQSIQIYVYARYLDGPWPGGVPYAGNVDVGYKTGTNTIWTGNTSTDLSGDYNLIQSAAYSTDSDGGTLDLIDINNLQISVRRGTFGPPQLRVTEIYAEITYLP